MAKYLISYIKNSSKNFNSYVTEDYQQMTPDTLEGIKKALEYEDDTGAWGASCKKNKIFILGFSKFTEDIKNYGIRYMKQVYNNITQYFSFAGDLSEISTCKIKYEGCSDTLSKEKINELEELCTNKSE